MLFLRIKQFYSAVTSKINTQDQMFLANHLNNREYRLFNTMDIPTQRHCLNVAYSCVTLSEYYPDLNIDILIRAALLHDCGKRAGEVKTWHRVLIVMTQALLPALAIKLAHLGFKEKGGSLGQAFYIQANHAERGAKILKNIGAEPTVVDLVFKHHQKVQAPTLELSILQKADNAN